MNADSRRSKRRPVGCKPGGIDNRDRRSALQDKPVTTGRCIHRTGIADAQGR